MFCLPSTDLIPTPSAFVVWKQTKMNRYLTIPSLKGQWQGKELLQCCTKLPQMFPGLWDATNLWDRQAIFHWPRALVPKVVTAGPINLRCSRFMLERSKTNQFLALWWFWRKSVGFSVPSLRYRVVMRRWGKVRWENQGDGVAEDSLCFLDESGWGQSRVHARTHGAAKPKLIRVS